MRKIYKFSLFILILLIGYSLGKINNMNDVYEEEKIQSPKKNENMLSMMLETEAESGNYEMTTRGSWPSSGYKFNPELSKCENGGELSWDDVNKRVLMSGNTSDKCYVYFDKDFIKLSLNNYTFSWNAVDDTTIYQIYSNDELLTSTSDTSAEIYGYYNEPGTYNISVKAIDSSSNVLLESNSVSYSLEKLDLDLSGNHTTEAKFTGDSVAGYYIKILRSEIVQVGDTINFLTLMNSNYKINYIDYVTNEKYHQELYSFSLDPDYFQILTKNNKLFDRNVCLFNSFCTNYNLNSFNYITEKGKLYYDLSSSSFMFTAINTGNFGGFIQLIEPGKIGTKWYAFYLQSLCLSSNTDVYVYDRKKKKFKKKKIRDIDFDDEILCWDFDKGEFAIAKPIWIKKCEQTNKYNLLKFSDGSTLETINQHRIFNVEKGMFTYPMSDDTPIGTTTFNSKGEYVKLISKEVIEKSIDYYNVMTEYHINLFANDILTSCRLSNMYKIKDMKYVCNKKRNNGYDLSKYDEKLVNGLRLKEQNIEEDKLKTYVDNMLRLMK